MQMHCEASVLGNAFANWSELTDEYMAGMHALRRQEPGASVRMMEIARLMSQYHQVVGGDSMIPTTAQDLTQPSAPRTANWLRTAAATLFRTYDSLALAH